MAKKAVYFRDIGEVTFYRNRRSKSIRISVKPGGSVLVSFPYFISEKEVLSFLSRNEEWIQRQRKNFNSLGKIFKEGSTIKTKLHTIKLYKGEQNNIEINGNDVKLTIEDIDSEKGQKSIDNILTRVYRYEAQQILPRQLHLLAVKYGFTYNKVTIRNNRSNWGSCSSGNNISLNLQVMKLPDQLIDYILLHELVHTEIKNHSQLFWSRLDQVTNHCARELACKVKNHSTYTF